MQMEREGDQKDSECEGDLFVMELDGIPSSLRSST
jgi:hypothetical protein